MVDGGDTIKTGDDLYPSTIKGGLILKFDNFMTFL